MTLILGIDPAQKTGWAYYDTSRSLAAIRAGVIKAEGDGYEEMAANLSRQLVVMMRRERPDFVSIESPLRAPLQARSAAKNRKGLDLDDQPDAAAGFGGLNAVISSNIMVGAIISAVAIKDVSWGMVSSATWRKTFLGFGRQPGWDRKAWKKATREKCAALRIPVTNDDMADAVGVAFAAPNHPIFKMMQHQRSKEAEAA
ncbi:hypothetical protein DYI37_03245 [Fulvimarina endophytica]|uniref:Uncharacterized protein n=1 Tax=Fulvimarina endophytica TaxID=2293836 RepID=A0A371XBA6_9HYPH|nr:hypothetical protein [Fulvimarina endophytica]RFC66471.1 hypothetical protein DYI37_03245 [Fulvimarina endophytica]